MTLKRAAVVGLVVVASFFENAHASEFKFDPYGFVRAEWLGATEGVASFGRPNLTAYTSVANPFVARNPDDGRASFQVGQSRIGVRIFDDEKRVDSRLEFDFVDFSKSSPTTTAMPRLRRAFVEYGVSEDFKIKAGQDWSMVSPANPFTYNPVGNYFESGNIGFMRIEAALYWKTDVFEHAFALTLPASNSATTDGPIELGVIPAIEARETVEFSDRFNGAFSAIVSSLPNGTGARFLAGAVSLSATYLRNSLGNSQDPGFCDIRFETYVGRNVSSLALLGVGTGDGEAHRPFELGAHLSARAPLSDRWSAITGVGAASVTDAEQVVMGGLVSNGTAHVGAEFSPVAGLAFYGEVAWLISRHQFLPSDRGIFELYRQATLIDIGTQLNF